MTETKEASSENFSLTCTFSCTSRVRNTMHKHAVSLLTVLHFTAHHAPLRLHYNTASLVSLISGRYTEFWGHPTF